MFTYIHSRLRRYYFKPPDNIHLHTSNSSVLLCGTYVTLHTTSNSSVLLCGTYVTLDTASNSSVLLCGTYVTLHTTINSSVLLCGTYVTLNTTINSRSTATRDMVNSDKRHGQQ